MKTPKQFPNENESSTDGSFETVAQFIPICSDSRREMIWIAIPRQVFGNRHEPNLAPLKKKNNFLFLKVSSTHLV